MIEFLEDRDFVLQFLNKGFVRDAAQVDGFHSVFNVQSRTSRGCGGGIIRRKQIAGSSLLRFVFFVLAAHQGRRIARGEIRRALRRAQPGFDRKQGVFRSSSSLSFASFVAGTFFLDAQFVFDAQSKEASDAKGQLKAFLFPFVGLYGLSNILPSRSANRLAPFLHQDHRSHRAITDRLLNLVVEQRIALFLFVHESRSELRGQQNQFAPGTFQVAHGKTPPGGHSFGCNRCLDRKSSTTDIVLKPRVVVCVEFALVFLHFQKVRCRLRCFPPVSHVPPFLFDLGL
mmetsp:Transcript_26953/g.74096  ORF Transcript_26953/g.74096 Transcript_26953/m.74096 type:complete len:286 (-) Transcript_26953:661-1518(-)